MRTWSSSSRPHLAGRTLPPEFGPLRGLPRSLSLPRKPARRPPEGAARRPGQAGGGAALNRGGQRVCISVAVPEQPRLLTSELQPRPRRGPGTGAGPGASPTSAQRAGFPAITSSARLRPPRESRVRTCKLRLVHLLPLSQRGRPSESWPTRGCSCWASSWRFWAGSAPSSARRCPSGRFTPMLVTTSWRPRPSTRGCGCPACRRAPGRSSAKSSTPCWIWTVSAFPTPPAVTQGGVMLIVQSCPTLRPHRLKPARLLCAWASPGKNTGVGRHFLLQGIFPTQRSNPGILDYRQILYCLSYRDPTPNGSLLE